MPSSTNRRFRWLKSYRSYKFEFVGLPAQPPDVHSATLGHDSSDVATSVHVSWNGATEVATWKLYKTDQYGKSGGKGPVTTLPRSGFETAFRIDKYASYVVVEGLDKQGKVLGKSNVAKTIVTSPLSDRVLAQEAIWLQNVGTDMQISWTSKAAYFVAVMACVVGLAYFAKWIHRLRRKGAFSRRRSEPVYELVPSENFDSFAIGEEDDGLESKVPNS